MKVIYIIFYAILVFAIDQASKWWVLYSLDLLSLHSVEIIPGFLNFILAWNTGINFGLFASDSTLTKTILIAFPVIVSIGLLWWNFVAKSLLLGIGSSLIIGGALANALDRGIYGAVVDFLNVTAFGLNNPFSFNIADIAIFLGAALTIIDLHFDSNEKENK